MNSIFLMGDSTLIKYKTKLYEFLSDKFDIYTKAGEMEALKYLDFPTGMNTGDSRMLLGFINEQQKQGKINYNYCMFNCGAHDIKRNAKTNEIQIELNEYEKNLIEIVKIFLQNKVKPIFVTSVPVYDDIHNSLVGDICIRRNEDLIKYNETAKKVMKQYSIPVIDLNYFTGLFGKDALCDHAHFKPEICSFQAAFISGALLSIVNEEFYEKDEEIK